MHSLPLNACHECVLSFMNGWIASDFFCCVGIVWHLNRASRTCSSSIQAKNASFIFRKVPFPFGHCSIVYSGTLITCRHSNGTWFAVWSFVFIVKIYFLPLFIRFNNQREIWIFSRGPLWLDTATELGVESLPSLALSSMIVARAFSLTAPWRQIN